MRDGQPYPTLWGGGVVVVVVAELWTQVERENHLE